MQGRCERVRRLGRRPVLDGLRGLAVLLVITEHTGLIGNGFMGVDVFFVLSGFLITTLLLEEWERRGGISLRDFYARRARRLGPALLLFGLAAILVDVVAYRLTGWGIGLKLVTTFGFANNWVAGLNLDAGHALGALNPTWSLAEEEQFYLLWPVALVLLLGRGLRPRTIFAVLVGAIAGLLVLEPVLAAHLSGYSDYYSPVDRAAELLMGCAASVAWRHRLLPLPAGALPAGGVVARADAPGGRQRGLALRVGVEAALLALTGLFTYLLLAVDVSDTRPVYLGAAAIAVVGLLLVIEFPTTLVGRALGWAPLRYLGTVSYGLYLIHLLARNVLVHYFPVLDESHWIEAGVTLTVGVCLATLSHRYVEMPIRRGERPAWVGALPGRSGAGSGRLRLPAHRPERRPVRSSA